jgi:hypothetical protein
VAHGVYKLSGSPSVDHLALRAAWLQLAPDQPAWARRIDVGVVSHRSAAALHGMGHLPADVHQFTLPVRRQSRRADVQLRLDRLGPSDVVTKEGILVTRPARTAAHLLADREDPQAVGQAIADALRAGEQPGRVERAIASHARAYGLAPDDGIVLLEWLLELTADPARGQWLREASAPSHDESAT